MKYENFKILFAQLELGNPTLPELSKYYGVSERTLCRWKDQGFHKTRRKKYFYCRQCEEYYEGMHTHHIRGKRLTKQEEKQAIINKYNKKIENYFKTY